jgi:eukaryotic-like serine/threonine-protein kinase
MQANSWLWIGKYLIVMIAALILGAVLGGLEPFRDATVGSSRVNAGALVQFIAHTGALALLWAMGLRHAAQLRRGAGRAVHLSSSVLALVSLIVIASFYGVLFRFISPFVAPDVKMYLDWSFIAAILAVACWLLWALFVDAESFLQAVGRNDSTHKSAGDAA